MAGKGYIITEDLDGGVRILPPSEWGAVYGGMTTFAVNLLASDQRETAFPLYLPGQNNPICRPSLLP